MPAEKMPTALRATTGFFVAAVVPVVAALVAEHTPQDKRARRFAWLGAMSLLGFLFGPALSAVANELGPWVTDAAVSPALSARVVLVLLALLGGAMMVELAASLPAALVGQVPAEAGAPSPLPGHPVALLWLSATVMCVLAGFELWVVPMPGCTWASASPLREMAVNMCRWSADIEVATVQLAMLLQCLQSDLVHPTYRRACRIG